MSLITPKDFSHVTPEYIDSAIRQNLHKSSDPAIYAGKDFNTDDPALYDSAKLRVLICLLSGPDAKTISATHLVLNTIIKEHCGDSVYVDFTFFPARTDLEYFYDKKIPIWWGLRSRRKATDFDILFVSNSICLERIHIPRALRDSGIPVFKDQRMQGEYPLILLGGANALNVEDLHGEYEGHQGMVDCVLLGDGEVTIPKFLDIAMDSKLSQSPEIRQAFLRYLHTAKDGGPIDGYYEPDKYECIFDGQKIKSIQVKPEFASYVQPKVKEATMRGLDQYPNFTRQILHGNGNNSGTVDLAISKGCSGSGGTCSFCVEGSTAGAWQERSRSSIEQAAHAVRKSVAPSSVNFYSFNHNYHSEYSNLLRTGYDIFGDVNFISQRVDVLAARPSYGLIQKYLGSNRTTLGVEGCSQRLRNYLNKSLTETQLKETITLFLKNKFAEVKLFFIITGMENERDLEEFTQLLDWIVQERQKWGVGTGFRTSWTPLFTSPLAALAWAPCLNSLNLGNDTMAPFVQACKDHGMGFRTSAKRSEIILNQSLFLADRRFTSPLIKYSLEDGFLYYFGVSKDNANKWLAQLATAGIDCKTLFEEKAEEHTFAVNHLHWGVTKEFRRKQYDTYVQFKGLQYCLKSPANLKPKCYQCGYCDAEQLKTQMNRTLEVPLQVDDFRDLKYKLADRSRYRIAIRLVDPITRFLDRKYFQYAATASIIREYPELEPLYNSPKGTSRDKCARADIDDFTYGVQYYDVAFRKTGAMDEVIEDPQFVERVNQHLQGLGWEITGAKKVPLEATSQNIGGFVVYRVPMEGVSLFDLRNKFAHFDAKKVKTIKSRIAKGKGSYTTVYKELTDNDVQWVVPRVENGIPVLYFKINFSLNPTFFLETVMKSKGTFRQSAKYEVKALAHVIHKDQDIISLLEGAGNQCPKCGEQMELDVFTETPVADTCVHCLFEQV